MYPKRAALWVLPDEMYGKYAKGTNPVFGHLHGSSWHGDDANTILWFVHHRTFLGLLSVGLGFAGLVWILLIWRMRRLRALHVSPVKSVQLQNVSIAKIR